MTLRMIGLAGTLWIAGCASALRPPDPEVYHALALTADESATADAVAGRIRDAGADYVLIAAPHEVPWFEELANETGLTLSGPGPTGTSSLAFLGPEALGDTTVAIPYGNGDLVVLHDALYEVPNNRLLDLMAFRLDVASAARPVVAALLRYIATDVPPQAAALIAIQVPDPAVGDSLAAMFSPAFNEAERCMPGGEPGTVRDGGHMQMFFGPRARIRCAEARVLEAEGWPLRARILVGPPPR